MADIRQICTFQLEGQLFGLPVEDVQEIINSPHMTLIPRTHAVIGGLMNLRGQIVTALHIGELLDLNHGTAAAGQMNVVMRTNDGMVSLVVDEIGDVIEVAGGLFEPPPDTLRGRSREFIDGIYKLPERLLLLLNTARLLECASRLGSTNVMETRIQDTKAT